MSQPKPAPTECSVRESRLSAMHPPGRVAPEYGPHGRGLNSARLSRARALAALEEALQFRPSPRAFHTVARDVSIERIAAPHEDV
jgi:hypothetical protein